MTVPWKLVLIEHRLAVQIKLRHGLPLLGWQCLLWYPVVACFSPVLPRGKLLMLVVVVHGRGRQGAAILHEHEVAGGGAITAVNILLRFESRRDDFPYS